MTPRRGLWTVPRSEGGPLPSAHKLDINWTGLVWRARCGRTIGSEADLARATLTAEPAGDEATCERCAILSLRDG